MSSSPVEDLDAPDRRLLDLIRRTFPLDSHPFASLAAITGLPEGEVLSRLRRLRDGDHFEGISMRFDLVSLGFDVAICAGAPEPDRLDRTAAIIAEHPGAMLVEAREGVPGLWWTLVTPPTVDGARQRLLIEQTAELRSIEIGPVRWLEPSPAPGSNGALTKLETAAVRVLTEDLPLDPAPFHVVAGRIGLDDAALLSLAHGFIADRLASGMAAHDQARTARATIAWRAPSTALAAAAAARLVEASQCYESRPSEAWPYDLVAVIEASNAEDLDRAVADAIVASELEGATVARTTKVFKHVRTIARADQIAEWEARFGDGYRAET